MKPTTPLRHCIRPWNGWSFTAEEANGCGDHCAPANGVMPVKLSPSHEAKGMAPPSDRERANNVSWLQTFTGRRIDLFAPRLEQIDIEDIAHALAHECRYAGMSESSTQLPSLR